MTGPKQCAHWWERRSKGKRYVNARGQCRKTTSHPSGYCKDHRFAHRWSKEQEAALARKRPPMDRLGASNSPRSPGSTPPGHNRASRDRWQPARREDGRMRYTDRDCPMTACELYRLARDAEAAYVAHLKRQFGADYNNGRYLRTWQARYDVFTSRAAADWHGLVSCYYTEVGNPAAAQDHADRVKEHQVRMWRAVAW